MTKIKTMTEGSPMRLILAFAAPMLLGNVFQQLYNLADSAIVGRFVGADALAAVGATGSAINLSMCLCFGMSNGAGIIIAQCFGAGSFRQLKETIGSLICVVSVMAAIIMIIGIVFARTLLSLLSTPIEIINDSVTYFRIIIAGMPFTMAYNTASAMLRSMGDSKTPLYMLIFSSFINIALDFVFVVLFKGGVPGAAVATVIATAFSSLACILYLIQNKNAFGLDGFKIHPYKRCVKQIFKTGTPMALQSSMIAIGTMSVQKLINNFGTAAIAAYTASTKIDSIAIMVVVSMGMSLSVYCGQNIGAGKPERIIKGLYGTLVAVLSYCAILALVMLFFGDKLLLLFLDPSESAEAFKIGTQYLKIIGIAYFMAGIMRCYLNVVHGTGDVNVSLFTGLTELGVRIAASYILAPILGLTGLWIAIPISWGVGSLIPVIRYYSGKWKNKTLINEID